MTVGAIKVTVHRMRARFRALVLGEIGETVGSQSELDDEVAHLHRVFG